MEIIDVTLSLYNLPKYQAVFKMQDVQVKIDTIANDIKAKKIKESKMLGKVKEMKALQTKMHALKSKY